VKRAPLALLPALAYAGLIFWLSSQPNPLPFLPQGLLSQDKLLHALEYAVLGGLLFAGLRLAGLRTGLAIAVAVLAASAYGASDELHQSFVPNRTADVLDWVADTLGALAGALAGAFAVALALRRPGRAG
jgi:VanZ family protein